MERRPENEEWCRAIIKELVHQGVRDYFIAPGSRSAPIVVAAAHHPLAATHVHFDERGLAFAALGCARAKKSPVAVVTTSGTAVANLYPAIVEANLDFVPLLFLTADRPFEDLQVGANQTIDQTKMFSSYLRGEWQIPPPSEEISLDTLANITAKAFRCSISPVRGPVVINCRFRKPLTDVTPSLTQKNQQERTTCRTQWLSHIKQPTSTTLHHLAELFLQHEKGVLVLGKMQEEEWIEEILTLSLKLQWPLFADPASNIRSLGRSSSSITFYNSLLQNTDAQQRLRPTLVVHLGDQCVSTALQEWLTTCPLEAYIHVSEEKTIDPYHVVSQRLECNPALFAKEILPLIPSSHPNLWLGLWKELSLSTEEKITDFFEEQDTLSEPGLVYLLGQQIRDPVHFYFGNSLPIRYADSYFYPRDKTGMIFTSRGTSGIDGSLAQAIGITKALQAPLICIVGDMTFLHDVNSLAMLTSSNLPLTIFVLNNQGNGIFSCLPIAQRTDVMEKYFTTPHSFTVAPFAEAFSIDYVQGPSLRSLGELVEQIPHRVGPLLIEIMSSCEGNQKFLATIDSYLHQQMKNKPSSVKTFYRDMLKIRGKICL